MASTINASNSGGGGIVQTGDGSGVLQLQTGSANAVTINASQQVGIGTTSPSTPLQVNGTTTSNTYVSPVVSTLTDGATITCNTAISNHFKVTLGGNRTFALSATPSIGTYIVYFIQDATGSRTITWPSSNWKWAGGSAPVMTTTANKIDVLMMVSDGTTVYASMSLNY